MVTLKDIFFNESRVMTCHYEMNLSTADGSLHSTVINRVHLDFDSNSKYWSFYIDDDKYLQIIDYLYTNQTVQTCHDQSNPLSVDIKSGLNDLDGNDFQIYPNLNNLNFTRMIILYINRKISTEIKSQIKQVGENNNFFVAIKDLSYMEFINRDTKPLAFISHDSRDKDPFVNSLAINLIRKYCPVWYDDFSLKIGDSLSESIRKGLKDINYCIIVVSNNFINNTGWGKHEFETILTREIHENKRVILPIWHNVTEEDVYNFCPILLDRLALNTSKESIEIIASKIAQVVLTKSNSPT